MLRASLIWYSGTSQWARRSGHREFAEATGWTPIFVPISVERAVNFRSAVGSMIYLAQDREGLQYCTKQLARHLQEPRETDWVDLVRAAKYIAGTTDAVIDSIVDKSKAIDEIEVC